MIARLAEAWRGLAARERRMVLLAGIVVLAALGWMLAFEPAWKGRERLADELPRARAQLSRLERMADEARQLSALPKSAESPQAQRAAVEASVRSAGLDGQMAQLSLSGELIDVRFKAVAFEAWLAWLDATLRETRLRVADVAVTREPQPGLVSVRLVLELPRQEAR